MGDSRTLHVLAAVGEPREADEVLSAAADLAARLTAHLDVAHVRPLFGPNLAGVPAGLGGLPPGPAVELPLAAEPGELERLREWISTELKDSNVAWSLHVREGDPAHVLGDLAESLDAYCIVVGTRGEGVRAFLERMIRPSVSHALIRDQRRPLLVVSS